MKTNSTLVGLILDMDIIFVSFKSNYNGSISQTSHVRNNKYIFKEIKLYYLSCPSLVNYEKQNERAHTYAHLDALTLIYTYIHIHTPANTHTHIHECTQRHTHARGPAFACTHTHKVFFRDRRPEFVEPLAAHCQGCWIQFFK